MLKLYLKKSLYGNNYINLLLENTIHDNNILLSCILNCLFQVVIYGSGSGLGSGSGV